MGRAAAFTLGALGFAAAMLVGVVVYLGPSFGTPAAAGAVKPATKKAPMTPTFYDSQTYEPLPASGVAAVPFRGPARTASAPASLVAPMTLPANVPFQLESAKPLATPAAIVRVVPLRDRLLALGQDGMLRTLGTDLSQRDQLFTPVGARVDPERDLVYLADPMGFLVARRLKDRTLAWRIVPSIPSGYERRVLWADATSILFASVELPAMTPGAPHVPEITMFEWWSLGNTAQVDPASFAPAGAAVRAATFTRTRPVHYAAGPGGDPLVLAQAGHVSWLNRELRLAADVAVPAEAKVLALDVDGEGRARAVARLPGGDRFWWLDRAGHALADAALPEHTPEGVEPVFLTGPQGGTDVISGRSLSRFDRDGVEKWHVQFPSAPVAAASDGAELLAVSGARLYRVHADGHADLLFQAREPLTAAPLVRSGSVVLAGSHEIFTVRPNR